MKKAKKKHRKLIYVLIKDLSKLMNGLPGVPVGTEYYYQEWINAWCHDELIGGWYTKEFMDSRPDFWKRK